MSKIIAFETGKALEEEKTMGFKEWMTHCIEKAPDGVVSAFMIVEHESMFTEYRFDITERDILYLCEVVRHHIMGPN